MFRLTVILFVLLALSSCYEPERYIPPVFLEPEVSLVVDNIPWDSVSETGFTLNYQNNLFHFGASNKVLNSGFSCTVRAKDREGVELFHDYSGDRIQLPFKTGVYRTNDTITVRMYYQLRGVGDASDGFPDYDYWDAYDTEFNALTIEEAFIEDLEIYVSGSFEARAEYSTYTQFPRYRFIEGTFKNVRVTKTYFKSQ